MPLTDLAIKNAKSRDKPYKLPDGGGLYLYVSTTGAKLWRYKYRITGKEGIYSIGTYPETSLAKAREEHLKARELVSLSTHPTHDRQQKKLVEQHEAGSTFKAVTKEWISKNNGRWSHYYLRQVEKVMERDVFPKIGALPIRQVTAAHILEIMRCAEDRGAETIAILIRQWCSATSAMLSPFLSVAVTMSISAAMLRPASAFVLPVFAASASISS